MFGGGSIGCNKWNVTKDAGSRFCKLCHFGMSLSPKNKVSEKFQVCSVSSVLRVFTLSSDTLHSWDLTARKTERQWKPR